MVWEFNSIIQCNYMDVHMVKMDEHRQPRTLLYIQLWLFLLHLFFIPTSFPLFFFFLSSLPMLLSSLSLPFFLTPAPPPFFFAPPPPTWEPDEPLMESTGSQHLPHLKRTGRSLLLSVPPRASLAFPLCSSLLPPSPMASSAESPQRSIVCPGEPC